MFNSNLRNGTIFIMAAVLVAGTIPMIIPSSFAQPYYEDPYAKDHKKASVNVQKIKCINENTNVNGIDITEIPQNDIATAEAQALEDTAPNENSLFGNGINFDKNLVNICVNVNVNEQVDTGQPGSPCEECFTQNLDAEELQRVLDVLASIDTDLQELCEFLASDADNLEKVNVLFDLFDVAEIPLDDQNTIFECLVDLGLIEES